MSIGWVPGTKWLCGQDAEGRWWGPNWVWEVYQSGDEVPPEPETGRCPQPWSYPQLIAIRTETEYAATTAVHMTELEVAGDYDRLYAWMHPDAKAIVSQAAMEGWYREVFAPRPPVWMTVDDVRLVEWTWGVTDKIYPSAAEVTYRQRFADGQETEGVTHLVRDHGVWRWFFGHNRAFVEEQIARASGQQPDVALGTSPTIATMPSPSATENAAYTILDLGAGDGNWGTADHINERGQVLWMWGRTGRSGDLDPESMADHHLMLWQDGTITDLSHLGIDYIRAINDAGHVAGDGIDVRGGSADQRVFLFADGTVTFFPDVEGLEANRAAGLERGGIVGQGLIGGEIHAFVLTPVR